MTPKSISRLSSASATVCVLTGIVYTVVAGSIFANPGPPRLLVLAASIIGGAGLVVTGRWQELNEPRARALPLLSLATLAGLYVLANVLGITFGQWWWTLFVVGVLVGASLFFTAAIALLEDQRTNSSGRQAG
ncbi:MAG: hypothetical protein ACXVPP_05880 [Actinomycetota bacterium]